MATPYEPKKLSPEEMSELHALPDDALATVQEAAAFLRLKSTPSRGIAATAEARSTPASARS